MASIFRRIYDWLLRLFWCVLPSHHLPSSTARALGMRPSAPSHDQISIDEKAICARRRRVRLLTDIAVQGHRDGHHHDRTAKRRQDIAAASFGGRRIHCRLHPDCGLQHEARPERPCNPEVRQACANHPSGIWDLGGQPRFRSMWERYCRGVNAMVFIVDSADRDALPVAREELKLLLEKPALEGIPLLVLGNKSDLPNKLSVDELIDALNLKAVSHREVSCYGISAKEETNLDAVLQWLIARASR